MIDPTAIEIPGLPEWLEARSLVLIPREERDRLAEMEALEPVRAVLARVETRKHEWPVMDIGASPSGGTFIACYSEVGSEAYARRDGDTPLAALRALAEALGEGEGA